MSLKTPVFIMFGQLAALLPLVVIQTSSLDARAAMSGAEKYAADGGRTLGAANACGFDSEEISIAMKDIMDSARRRAINLEEKEAVQSAFVEGLKSGVAAVRSGHATCIDTRDDLTRIEDEASQK